MAKCLEMVFYSWGYPLGEGTVEESSGVLALLFQASTMIDPIGLMKKIIMKWSMKEFSKRGRRIRL